MRTAITAQRKTAGYVLRTYDFGEADRIAVLLTPAEGRIDGVVRGARRMKRRSSAALELLSWVGVSYRERPGRDLVSFGSIELRRSSFELLSHHDSLETFSHLSDLSQAVAVPGEGRERLVRLIDAALASFAEVAAAGKETRRAALELLRVYFDLWVARFEGFWPDLSACGACQEPPGEILRVGLHIEGALCRKCARGLPVQTLPLGRATVGLARRIVREAPRQLIAEAPPAAAIAELQTAVSALLTVHLDRALKTVRVPPVVRRQRLALPRDASHRSG